MWIVLAALASAADLTVTHQGRLLDAQGAPLSGEHQLRVRLYDGADAVRFDDTFTVDLADGYFSVVLGSGEALTHADLYPGPVFLGVAVDGGAELSVRQQLHAAPYAAHAMGVTLGAVAACSPATAGTLRYDGGLHLCVGTHWESVQTGRDGSSGSPGTSCRQVHEDFPLLPSGPYFLTLPGVGVVQAYCDMSTAGGGWTRVMTTDASLPLCNLTAAQGTKEAVATGTGTAWWPAADVALLPFDEVLVWDSASNYVRFKSTDPSWAWTAVANGTFNSFTHPGLVAARNTDSAFTGVKSQGCSYQGCLLGGGYNDTGDWTILLGIGANAGGGFTQSPSCAPSGNRGIYGGALNGNWNQDGYAYVR